MKPILMYTTQICSYCVRAKMLLEHLGLPFEEIRIDKDFDKMQEMLEKTDGKRTVPQIMIGETSIGGFDELSKLHQSGMLDAMLKD